MSSRHPLPARAVPLALLCALLTTASLRAQDLRGERGEKGVRLPTALMLRRIAEAVDGDRSGGRVWVVASAQPTTPVLGVFGNPEEAMARARDAGPLAGVFGPYQTEADPGAPFSVACIHLKTSVMSSDRCVPPAQPIRPRDITGLTLIISGPGGIRDSLPLPLGTDAIFLTMPAIDKFVVPYYQRVLGLPLTNDLQQDLRGAYGPH